MHFEIGNIVLYTSQRSHCVTRQRSAASIHLLDLYEWVKQMLFVSIFCILGLHHGRKWQDLEWKLNRYQPSPALLPLEVNKKRQSKGKGKEGKEGKDGKGERRRTLGNDIRRSMAKGKMHETWLNGFYKCAIFWHMWDIAPFVEYTWYHLTSLLFFHVAWTWKNPSVPVLGVSRWYLIEWTWGTTWILWPWDLERSMQNTSKYCANDV